MSKNHGFVERMKSDSVAFSPLIGLPVLTVFLSATAHGTSFVSFVSVASLAAIALLFVLVRVDRPSRLHSVLAASSALLVGSIALTHWPLRAAFKLAEARLDEHADVVRSGGSVDGKSAGWFTIREGRIDQRGIVLELVGHRYEYCAFVRSDSSDHRGYRLSRRWFHQVLR